MDVDARDRAAQHAFERYELVLSALLASHARSGRVLDQWAVEDLAASLPEYTAFRAAQREYNAAVCALVSGAKLGELGAQLSTRDGEGAQKPNGDALPSTPAPPPRATLALTPATRRATAGRHPPRLRTTPQHQGGHKRRRLLGRMLSAVRYPQRLLRLRRPGAKYVEGTEVGRGRGRGEHPGWSDTELTQQGSATVIVGGQQTRRSAKLVAGPA